MNRKSSTIAIASCVVLLSSMNVYSDGKVYKWQYWFNEQGIYKRSNGDLIRFLNIEYEGPNNPQLWRQCFHDAAKRYENENVTYRTGGDNDFFTISALPQSKKRILGWYDYKSSRGGYIVITEVHADRVVYVTIDGARHTRGTDPNNYNKWKLYHESGDWGPGITHYAAVQIWKHGGTTDATAAAAFWFRSEGGI